MSDSWKRRLASVVWQHRTPLKLSQIKAYISQPAFQEVDRSVFSLKCTGKFSDFERLSLISPIQQMGKKPFFSNCFSFTLISFQSYSYCTIRTLEVSFSIILYAQCFVTYNVIHARTYLMEKKMIPLSELCIPFNITLIERTVLQSK